MLDDYVQCIFYTQSQKKCTVESCVSFGGYCKEIDFFVYFILPMLFVTIFVTGSHGKRMNPWCVSLETECSVYFIFYHLLQLFHNIELFPKVSRLKP